MERSWIFLVCGCWLAALPGGSAWGVQTLRDGAELPMKDVLVVRSGGRAGRSVVRMDAVEARIVSGQWSAPQVGSTEPGTRGGERRWEAATANEKGVLSEDAVRGGYIYWPVVSPSRQVMMLEAAGHSCVYVNGEIRTGDPYGYGYLRLPVLLREGTNEFLFLSGRGELRAKLLASPAPLSIQVGDSTLPDLIEGEKEPVWGGVVLVNATTSGMNVSLRALEKGSPANVVSIPPLGVRKAGFLLRPPTRKGTNSCSIALEATDIQHPAKTPVHTRVNLRIRQPNQTYVRTFRSEIDGSVQYYAVNPSFSPGEAAKGQAMFLSLHGAGVEARGQAEAYSPKKWGTLVCPTNRRPYGFDWEEWGRWDALEVLGLAQHRYQPDPSRVYLTGHSMGGHGTWQLGVLFPDRFAAIGPSAGWISFRSYADPGRSQATNALQQMFLRASAASDTLLMATNYLQEGVYILHGDADDNVPVSEAREMRRVLGEFHRDFDFFEQPKAGHWWDASDEPGADCVDWAPMFDFFAHHRIPSQESVRRVRFSTVNPAVSHRSHWVSILAQERQLETSVVDMRCDPLKRRVVGVTTNVSCLGLDFPGLSPGGGVAIEVDGQKIDVAIETPAQSKRKGGDGLAITGKGAQPRVCLVRRGGNWELGAYPSVAMKRPERSGPFREAFRNRMTFVYGTRGTPEENAWSLMKARYDAETFYYRGNGSIEVMADVEAAATTLGRKGREAKATDSRNFVVYGHADCNAAWDSLLAQSPVQARRGRLKVGDREFVGTDLGFLFLQPHPNDGNALVGVVGGSGLPGMRVTERTPYFLSGAGIPDLLVLSPDLLTKGIDGVRGAGFFGQDWQINSGDFVWKE